MIFSMDEWDVPSRVRLRPALFSTQDSLAGRQDR